MRAITLAASVLLCSAAAAGANPNLKPHFSVSDGVVGVTNEGASAATNKSVATVRCKKVSGPGSCPDPTPAQAAPYEMPGFPNVAAIVTPPIKAGDGFKHEIAFFNSLVFAPGKYAFTVCVDAGKDIKESSEKDNCERFLKVVK